MTPVVEGKVWLEAHLDVVLAKRLALGRLPESRYNRIDFDSDPFEPMHASSKDRLVHISEHQPIMQASAEVGFRFRGPYS
jgi:hypothetical protein